MKCAACDSEISISILTPVFVRKHVQGVGAVEVPLKVRGRQVDVRLCEPCFDASNDEWKANLRLTLE